MRPSAVDAARTALRVWWWRLRYAWRVFARSRARSDFVGSYLRWCLADCSRAGWEVAVETMRAERGDPVALVLDHVDPRDEADEELSNWEDDES